MVRRKSPGTAEKPGVEASLTLAAGRIVHGHKLVLDNINLGIVRGESCLVTGVNGSGKTSLMRSILGFIPLGAGHLHSSFRRIGYVPQERTVDRQFPVTIRACLNMSFPGFRYAYSPSARLARRNAVNTALEMVGLAGKEEQMLRGSSGGEIQRTLFARALVLEPDLLVLDEPTASLDARGKAEIMALLETLHRNGTTILMTSHDVGYPRRFITHEIQIADGHVRKKARP